MRAQHVDAQREQLVNLNSERQNLVNERGELEKSYPGLSEDHEKLEKVRTTIQTNPLLHIIHVAHEDAVSKTAEFDKVKQDLQSVQSELDKSGAALKKQIVCKNKHVEQVRQLS